jgi:ribosomal protein L32
LKSLQICMDVGEYRVSHHVMKAYFRAIRGI